MEFYSDQSVRRNEYSAAITQNWQGFLAYIGGGLEINSKKIITCHLSMLFS